MRKRPVVAIDGPSGVGKSTAARGLAALLEYTYIDTGALYRALAWLAQSNKIDWQDGSVVAGLVPKHEFQFLSGGELAVDGEIVKDLIRTPAMSLGASEVARQKEVRDALVEIQRDLGRDGGVVLEGRDIGTVVFPDAEVKFFLSASAGVRAKRRFLELKSLGEEVSLAEVERDQELRDKADRTRSISPLKRSDDAIEIDCDDMSAEEVIAYMIGLVKSKFPLTFKLKA